MFRGGDYVDNPRFYNNDTMIKNTLDVSVRFDCLLLLLGYPRGQREEQLPSSEPEP